MKVNQGKELILNLKIKIIKDPDVTVVYYLACPAESNGETLGVSPVPALGNRKHADLCTQEPSALTGSDMLQPVAWRGKFNTWISNVSLLSQHPKPSPDI